RAVHGGHRQEITLLLEDRHHAVRPARTLSDRVHELGEVVGLEQTLDLFVGRATPVYDRGGRGNSRQQERAALPPTALSPHTLARCNRHGADSRTRRDAGTAARRQRTPPRRDGVRKRTASRNCAPPGRSTGWRRAAANRRPPSPASAPR